MSSVHGVFIFRVLSVMSYELLCDESSLDALTFRRVVSHQVKRTHNREGDGLQFVPICSTAVEYLCVFVVYAVRKCTSYLVYVFVVFVVEEYIPF